MTVLRLAPSQSVSHVNHLETRWIVSIAQMGGAPIESDGVSAIALPVVEPLQDQINTQQMPIYVMKMF